MPCNEAQAAPFVERQGLQGDLEGESMPSFAILGAKGRRASADAPVVEQSMRKEPRSNTEVRTRGELP